MVNCFGLFRVLGTDLERILDGPVGLSKIRCSEKLCICKIIECVLSYKT